MPVLFPIICDIRKLWQLKLQHLTYHTSYFLKLQHFTYQTSYCMVHWLVQAGTTGDRKTDGWDSDTAGCEMTGSGWCSCRTGGELVVSAPLCSFDDEGFTPIFWERSCWTRLSCLFVKLSMFLELALYVDRGRALDSIWRFHCLTMKDGWYSYRLKQFVLANIGIRKPSKHWHNNL